jgi:DNA-nicking Smr family endonuclease
VGRKKKKKKPAAAPTGPKAAPSVGTSLKSLLSAVSLEAPTNVDAPAEAPPKRKTGPRPPSPKREEPALPVDRPSQGLRGHDRTAYFDAMAGVRPLGATPRARPVDEPRPRSAPPPPRVSPADEEARARLAALVAGGVRFDLDRLEDSIRGRRVGTPVSVAEGLGRRGVVPEASLDLHGMRADEAERAVVRFVRQQHRRGARRLCIVHGKGRNSDGGVGVLRDVVVHALTEAGAAPVVLAFASAPIELGGTGALMVELTR